MQSQISTACPTTHRCVHIRHASRQLTRKLRCSAALHARWCFDARYGCKQEATLLLQEWVQTVGRTAGLSMQNTRLSSGSVGIPESRLEMEVTFDSMTEFEGFLSSIPFHDHKAWTQRIASMVVDGSPVWQIHRSIPLAVSPAGEAAVTRAAPASTSTQPSSSSAPKQLVFTDQISTADMAAWEQLKRDSDSGSSSGSSSPVAPATPASPASSELEGPAVQRDWKGDPIKFNPGDKLPFKFL